MWFNPQALLAARQPTPAVSAISAISAASVYGDQQKTAKPQKPQPPTAEVKHPKTAEPQKPQALIPDPDAYCWPHSTAMNTQEISLFIQRLEVFAWKGVAQPEAESLADALVLRDRDGDDRKLCLECCHLRGGAGPWCCANATAAQMAVNTHHVDLPAGLTRQLQRCPGFKQDTLCPGVS